MATFHHDGDTVQLFVKGAPDVLLARAGHCADGRAAPLLDEAARAAFVAENEALAGQALRVLAVAGRVIPADEFDPTGDLMRLGPRPDLHGLVGIIDPPRPEAREAIAVCRAAGIQVKMITGDHAPPPPPSPANSACTAKRHERRRARRPRPRRELAALVERIAVFARVAPEHKVRIVEALQAAGHVVAMTGDGVNDAPALKTADIGVAMGITGTEVTKEAATLVLTDDNFATIVRAVEEGRIIYDNIVKFVRFQLSTNIGAILTVLAPRLLGLATPFTAIQILWINIIMDGPPAMTLGVEPARPGIMRDAAAPADAAHPLLAALLAHLALYGLTMTVGTLGVYACGAGARRRGQGADAGLHHLRPVPVLQRLQRPRRARQRLQPPLLPQRQAVAGAGGRRRPAGRRGALAAGAGDIRHRRSDPGRLGPGAGSPPARCCWRRRASSCRGSRDAGGFHHERDALRNCRCCPLNAGHAAR